MVGSIGAIGVSLNLAPLLEVTMLVHNHHYQCQCWSTITTINVTNGTITTIKTTNVTLKANNQPLLLQKLGVVPVIVTSGERKGFGQF